MQPAIKRFFLTLSILSLHVLGIFRHFVSNDYEDFVLAYSTCLIAR